MAQRWRMADDSIYSGMYFCIEARSLITHDSSLRPVSFTFDFYGSKLFSQGAPEKKSDK